MFGRTAWPRTSLRKDIQTIAILLTDGFVGFAIQACSGQADSSKLGAESFVSMEIRLADMLHKITNQSPVSPLTSLYNYSRFARGLAGMLSSDIVQALLFQQSMKKQIFIGPSDGNSIGWTIFHRRSGYFQFP